MFSREYIDGTDGSGLFHELITILAGSVFEYGVVLELEELYEEALPAAKELDDEGYSPEGIYRDSERTRPIILYFTYVSILQESLLAELVHSEVFEESAQTESSYEWVQNQSAQQNLDLLHATEVIDSGLKGEIGQVKSLRNDMTHNLEDRLIPSSNQSMESQVERGHRSVGKLISHIEAVARRDGDREE